MSHHTRNGILDRLFRSEAPGLARFLKSRIGRHEDIHDLVQDAFAHMASARASAYTDKPEAYLQRIARNLLYDRSRRTDIRLAGLHVPVEEALSVSTSADQGWAIEADDARKRYLAALDELPSRTREIFLLNRADGLTYHEIAERLGVTNKGIEYHMARALAHLHRTFYGE
ncbi:RNA polymerase sigma factor [Sphingomonas oryzagri]